MLSSRLCLLTLLCLCLLCLTSCQPSPFDTKLISSLTPTSFRAVVANHKQAAIVLFYQGSDKQLAQILPQYSTTAKSVGANAKPCAFDCRLYSSLCNKEGVEGIKLRMYVAGANLTYKASGEWKHTELTQWVWDKLPAVRALTAKTKYTMSVDVPRMLLFTDKRETSPMLKSMALELAGSVDVFEVRKTERALLDKYGIGKSFPVLMIEFLSSSDAPEPSVRIYSGKFERGAILTWALTFAKNKPQAGNSDTTAAAAAAADEPAPVPELVDNSCLQQLCGGPLCAVLTIAKEAADRTKQLQQFHAVQNLLNDKTFQFVWLDSTSHGEWLQNNFDITPQDYAQIFMLSVKKQRFLKHIGTTANDDVLAFLKAVKKGKRTDTFFTRDGALFPMRNDTLACPPKQEEKKPASSSSSATNPNEEGSVAELTTNTHDQLILNSKQAWVILFHNGNAHDSVEQYKNLTFDFDRVAKKLKNMVRFGTVDVASQPQLATQYGITPDQAPIIKKYEYELASKTLDAVQSYEGSNFDARSIMDESLRLLSYAHVNVISAQNMSAIMGDLQPDMPFVPIVVLFIKPQPDGHVKIPDMIASLSMEFHTTQKFAVASSRDVALARQFNVTKIPSVYLLSLEGNTMPKDGNVRLSANLYPGGLTYNELHHFSSNIEVQYNKLAQQYQEAAKKQPKKQATTNAKSSTKASAKKSGDDNDHIDLDKDEL